MRILHIAAECAPLAKVGGLGDVLGSLPASLASLGEDVWVVLPRYGDIPDLGSETTLARVPVSLGGRTWDVNLIKAIHPSGFPVVLLDCPEMYQRQGIYNDPTGLEWGDTLERCGILCRGALWAAQIVGGTWDILHAHDAHAAPSLVMAATGYSHGPLGQAARILSLHNLAHQGLHPLPAAASLDLPLSDTWPGGPLEFWGRLSLLKGGICYADGLHTVSPTHAREIISSSQQGFGMEGLLAARAGVLRGITNGINDIEWDPARDPRLVAHYSADDFSGKRRCKEALFQLAGWEPAGIEAPLLVVVSRLAWQKGLDQILDSLPSLLTAGARLMVLGKGEADLERRFREAAENHPTSVWFHCGFDEELAHRLEAGGDLFLMPSRFEPCGLNQMYSQRYGTPPVARRTGGLVDTIEDVSGDGSSGTGFLYSEESGGALIHAIHRALSWYGSSTWTEIQKRGMAKDFSWDRAAREMVEWYREIRYR